jgi:hypothetical protein
MTTPDEHPLRRVIEDTFGPVAWRIENSLGSFVTDSFDIADNERKRGCGKIEPLYTSPPEHSARIAELEGAISDFLPFAQVAFLWTKGEPPEAEVDRYRKQYHALSKTLHSKQKGTTHHTSPSPSPSHGEGGPRLAVVGGASSDLKGGA